MYIKKVKKKKKKVSKVNIDKQKWWIFVWDGFFNSSGATMKNKWTEKQHKSAQTARKATELDPSFVFWWNASDAKIFPFWRHLNKGVLLLKELPTCLHQFFLPDNLFYCTKMLKLLHLHKSHISWSCKYFMWLRYYIKMVMLVFRSNVSWINCILTGII